MKIEPEEKMSPRLETYVLLGYYEGTVREIEKVAIAMLEDPDLRIQTNEAFRAIRRACELAKNYQAKQILSKPPKQRRCPGDGQKD